MKKNFASALIGIFIFMSNAHSQYAHQNISLYSNWHDSTVVAEPVYGIKYSGCYGYAHAGKEYAILGSSAGTYFIDVTNPYTPAYCDYVAGARDSCIWREYRTYQHYLYTVSDDPAPNSFQIIDLNYLPDSVHVVYDSTDIFSRSHTIFIDGDKLYCGSVTSSTGSYSSMNIYSLANPAAPVLMRKLNQDYPSIAQVHDMLVRNDTIYASCGNGGLYLFTYNATGNQFNMIGSLTSYNFNGYNHSSALSPDGKILVFADEVPTGLPMKVYDVSDPTDIQFRSNFHSHTGATPHNPYMVGNKVVLAYYEDGVYIYDISVPAAPVLSGYFDTHPQNGATYTGYAGCWGAYTDLPSHHLIAGDMQNGLFMLNADSLLSSANDPAAPFSTPLVKFQNPSAEKIDLYITVKETEDVLFSLTDLQGKILISGHQKCVSGNNSIQINTSKVSPGMYLLNISSRSFSSSYKWIRM